MNKERLEDLDERKRKQYGSWTEKKRSTKAKQLRESRGEALK